MKEIKRGLYIGKNERGHLFETWKKYDPDEHEFETFPLNMFLDTDMDTLIKGEEYVLIILEDDNLITVNKAA